MVLLAALLVIRRNIIMVVQILLELKRQARPDEPIRTGIETPAWMNQFGQGNPFFVGQPAKKD